MKRPAILTVVLMLVLFAGCSEAEVGRGDTQSSGIRETVRQEEQVKLEKEDELVLSFVGDMMFDKSVAAYIKAKGEDYIFDGYRRHFESSDMVFGNLETVLSTKGEPVKDKQYTFRSSPKLLPYLKKYNFTMLGIANNHTLDYGRDAFTDTLKQLDENGISYAGGGLNKEEASGGVVVERKGLKIGFIAFSRVTPSVDWYAGRYRSGILGGYKVHEAEVLEAVKSLEARSDILVVSLHWGKEGMLQMGEQESELAHLLIDSGADVIMGHHPHVVQKVELYNGKPIFYSLGNFFFTTSHSEISNKVLLATIRYGSDGKLKKIEAVPGVILQGRPVPMEGAQKQDFIDYLNSMNTGIKL